MRSLKSVGAVVAEIESPKQWLMDRVTARARHIHLSPAKIPDWPVDCFEYVPGRTPKED